jgi:transketolase
MNKHLSETNCLTELAAKTLSICCKAREGHIPSALSVLDILHSIYSERYEQIVSGEDFFVLAKGHASIALYVTLVHMKLLHPDALDTFAEYRSILGGHPDRTKSRYITASTGSLGHGLPISVGIALGQKISSEKGRVFCLVGDGELNEGSNWEALLVANHHKLHNLTLIVDANSSSNRAIDMSNLSEKLSAFGLDVNTVDGHNLDALAVALNQKNTTQPNAIIAKTIKGYRVKSMENNPAWHHAYPSENDLEKLMKELS